ncbi:hypothetical protein ACFL41_02430 [Gemmatimonadota bacterium]
MKRTGFPAINRSHAAISSIKSAIILCMYLIGSGCAGSTIVTNDTMQATFHLDLDIGTEWHYQDFGAPADDSPPITVFIEEEIKGWFKSICIRTPDTSHHYRADIHGYLRRLSANDPRFGSGNDLWANTSMGLATIETRISTYGYIKVPSSESPVQSIWYIDAGWRVANRDTLISVPAGDFRCIMIQYISVPDVIYRPVEFWAPGIGLIRRQVIPNDWQLVTYTRGNRK